MKNVAHAFILAGSLASAAVGGPLQKDQVAADAKWFVHLDVDKLRSTTLGNSLMRQFLQPKLEDLKSKLDFDVDWNKIGSLTAYGTTLGSHRNFQGVLLIKTSLDLEKLLNSAIQKFGERGEDAPVQRTQDGAVTTYSLRGGKAYASFKAGRPIIVSRSRDSISKAEEVLGGTAPNLNSVKTFSDYPRATQSFFVLGAIDMAQFNAEANQSEDDGKAVNPRAKVLKLAEGGRIMLGEESDQLILNASLKAKTPEVVTQMQQVIQGMIALAALSQSDNRDLQDLSQSAKVSASGNIVTLTLGFPTERALGMLNDRLAGHREHAKHAREAGDGESKPKSKHSDQQTEPAESDSR